MMQTRNTNPRSLAITVKFHAQVARDRKDRLTNGEIVESKLTRGQHFVVQAL